MTDERSQEELAGGFLRCQVGASTIDLPTLKMRDERGWKILLAKRLNELAETEVGEADFTDFGNPATLKATAELIHLPAEAALDLLVAYDKTGVLGGKEGIEETMDSAQIWALLRRVFFVVFPFVTSIGSMLSEIQRIGMSPSLVSGLTNGASPTGTSPPAH